MIDGFCWKIQLCDLCLKDKDLLNELEKRLIGIMENGQWVDGFSDEKAKACNVIRGQWEKEITCPCLVIWADMEHISICERHLKEAIDEKSKFTEVLEYNHRDILFDHCYGQ